MAESQSNNPPIKQPDSKQALFRWVLSVLLKKGYSSRNITPALLKAFKQLKGDKTALMAWANSRPSYHQSVPPTPRNPASFIENQTKPAVIALLIKKGYSLAASSKITQLLVSHSGDHSQGSISKLWQSAKDWPASTQTVIA